MTDVVKRAVRALVTCVALQLAAPAAAQEAAGDWVGRLQPAPDTRVAVVVHIERDEAGMLSGTMALPLQAVQGLPLAGIAVETGSLTFTVPAIGVTWRGQWNAGARAWKGEWIEAGQRLPLSLGAVPAAATLPADWQLPSDDAIAAVIAARNAPRAGQGIVVGVLGPGGRRIVAGGSGTSAAVDGNTLFEIGSISKVFTGLILGDMVGKGEVSLDDPAAKYLPEGHTMPERGGRQITLGDLATHRSGLPRMADDMRPIAHPDGPFADYTEARLLALLDRYRLPRDPGSQWEYSNLGGGLLGYLLGRAAGSDFATLLRERITGPLGMSDTMVALSPSHAARLVPALDAYMQPANPWDFAVLAGAGGIRSSAADMLTFAAAVLDPTSPIAPAVRTALAVRVPGEAPEVDQALGWGVARPAPGRELWAHGGQTGGFRAQLALEPAKGRAVIVLANSAAEPSAPDLAMHVLIGSPVLPTPPVPPAPPPPVQRQGIPGAPALPIYPETPLRSSGR